MNAGTFAGSAIIYLIFCGCVLGQIAVLSRRRWNGQVEPDYSTWKAREILADRRYRLALGILLAAAWTSVALALIRDALKPGTSPILAAHLGPLPIPEWFAFIVQEGYVNGLMFALWATALWLDRSVSKKWSRNMWPPGLRAVGFPMMLAIFALVLSAWQN
jgi:hypothetical protein